MKALIWKEVRELAPGFWLLLGSCWALGVVDVAYNWNEDRAAGLSLIFCWLVSMVAALLAGAMTFAREQPAQRVFLGAWPLPRLRLWLVKTLVPAVMWALLMALAVGGCMALLEMRGHEAALDTQSFFGNESWLHISAYALLFAGGLLLSTAVNSAMAAAVVAVVGIVAAGWGYLALYEWLPAHFGPRLGLVLPDADEAEHLIPALIVAGACVLASAIAAKVAYFRGVSRRVLVAVGMVLGTLVVVVVVALAWWLHATSGFPVEPRTPLDGTGQYVLFVAPREQDREGLWSLDVHSGELAHITRGPVNRFHQAADAPRVALRWDWRDTWVADAAAGDLWRMPEDLGGEELSRDGEWVVGFEEEKLRLVSVERPRAEPVTVDLSAFMTDAGYLIGWSPDMRTLYVGGWSPAAADAGRGSDRLIAVHPFDDRPPRVLREFEYDWWPGEISPDGRWLTTAKRVHRDGRQLPVLPGPLINLVTGRAVDTGGILVWGSGWTADSRYVWGRPADAYGRPLAQWETVVLDPDTGEVVRTLAAEDLDGWVPRHCTPSPVSPHVLIFALLPGEDGHTRGWWLAEPDGTDPRPLGIEHIIGWSDTGEIVLRAGSRCEALAPETGARRLIRELPAPRTIDRDA